MIEEGQMRILHTMIRVGDLERSIRFYRDVLGMKLFRQLDFEKGRFTLAFLGYGEEADQPAVELTYNWDRDRYDLGDGFGHIALGVSDAYQACADIKKRGGKVVREAGPMMGGPVIAFLEDPDGYKVELVQQ
jgi:lactoylglutathione lyase